MGGEGVSGGLLVGGEGVGGGLLVVISTSTTIVIMHGFAYKLLSIHLSIAKIPPHEMFRSLIPPM